MKNPLPAIAIGGPPHSGKSVLTYNLSQALRQQQIAHFVVRACPDSEGDYSQEISSTLMRQIRQKGQFDSEFVENVCRALRKRHYPLMVDVGGKPTEEQEAIFNECTHAIIISSDPKASPEWHDRVERHELTLLADLHSIRSGKDEIVSAASTLRGQISDLERGQKVDSPVFDLLLKRIGAFFTEFSSDVRERHLNSAPSMPLDLARLGRALAIQNDGTRWSPNDLLKVVDYLPTNEALSVFERGPTWLYAIIANHVYPAELHQFDPCLGWVTPMKPKPFDGNESTHTKGPKLMWTLNEHAGFQRVELAISEDGYLDYEDELWFNPPPLSMDKGLILSGALPMWLITGLVDLFHELPLLAIFQPSLEGAVVIKSSIPNWPIGSVIR